MLVFCSMQWTLWYIQWEKHFQMFAGKHIEIDPTFSCFFHAQSQHPIITANNYFIMTIEFKFSVFFFRSNNNNNDSWFSGLFCQTSTNDVHKKDDGKLKDHWILERNHEEKYLMFRNIEHFMASLLHACCDLYHFLNEMPLLKGIFFFRRNFAQYFS